jgi:hypothetical protein
MCLHGYCCAAQGGWWHLHAAAANRAKGIQAATERTGLTYAAALQSAADSHAMVTGMLLLTRQSSSSSWSRCVAMCRQHWELAGLTGWWVPCSPCFQLRACWQGSGGGPAGCWVCVHSQHVLALGVSLQACILVWQEPHIVHCAGCAAVGCLVCLLLLAWLLGQASVLGLNYAQCTTTPTASGLLRVMPMACVVYVLGSDSLTCKTWT